VASFRQFEAARADPSSAAGEAFRDAHTRDSLPPPVPLRVWVSRWRWPLMAMSVAAIAAITCVLVGLLSPDEDIDVYHFVAGFGGGVFGSTVVASVVFLVEVKRSEIRSIEQLQSDRLELSALEHAITERLAAPDGHTHAELIRGEINSSRDSLEESLAVLAAQLERIEKSLS